MTSPFLKLFNISLCSIWPGSIWLQLSQMTCSLFEPLMEHILVHILGIGANTCWWDTIPQKQQQQGIMWFTSGCHWEDPSSFKVIVLGEIDSQYLTIVTCYQAWMVHTLVLNLEYPLIFYTSAIRRHKTHKHHPRYFCFFMSLNSFWLTSCHFLCDLRSGWLKASLNVWGSSSIYVTTLTVKD